MTPKKICVFLRGINVNGIKISMADLKDAFIRMGFDHVKTILATGNVILTVPEDLLTTDLKGLIEAELSRQFNYEAYVLIRSEAEIGEIIRAAKDVPTSDSEHLYALLCQSESIVNELYPLFLSSSPFPEESLLCLKSDALWKIAKGNTLQSTFSKKILSSKKFKSVLTSRNINTIEKCLNALQA